MTQLHASEAFDRSLEALPDEPAAAAVVAELLHLARHAPRSAPRLEGSELRVIYVRAEPPYPHLRLTYSVDGETVRLWSIDGDRVSSPSP